MTSEGHLDVIVAGGAGFIGGHLCAALIEAGHRVLCVDNLCTGRVANIEPLLASPGFTFERADVTATPYHRADLIFHLASPASPVHYRRLALETMAANSMGTLRLLEIAREYHARFVFASTSEIYGEPAVHPQPETYWGNVNPNGVRACYDESKRFGEALTFEYRRTRAVNATIVRIFNTYGPGMDPADGRVIPAFITAALEGRPLPIEGDGTQTRAFCFVSDLVRGLLEVAFDHDADGEVFNLGDPTEHTMLELAEVVAAQVHTPVALEFHPAAQDSPTRRRPDITKVRARYGWSPTVTLNDGIAATVVDFAGRMRTPLTTEAL